MLWLSGRLHIEGRSNEGLLIAVQRQKTSSPLISCSLLPIFRFRLTMLPDGYFLHLGETLRLEEHGPNVDDFSNVCRSLETRFEGQYKQPAFCYLLKNFGY